MKLHNLRKGDIITIRHYFKYVPGKPLTFKTHDFKVVKVWAPGHFVDVEPQPHITQFNGFHKDCVVKRKG